MRELIGRLALTFGPYEGIAPIKVCPYDVKYLRNLLDSGAYTGDSDLMMYIQHYEVEERMKRNRLMGHVAPRAIPQPPPHAQPAHRANPAAAIEPNFWVQAAARAADMAAAQVEPGFINHPPQRRPALNVWVLDKIKGLADE